MKKQIIERAFALGVVLLSSLTWLVMFMDLPMWMEVTASIYLVVLIITAMFIAVSFLVSGGKV